MNTRGRALTLSVLFLAFQPCLRAQTQAPRKGKEAERLKGLLKQVKASTVLPDGWTVETPSHVLHSTVSRDYTATAALHLWRFDRHFRTIFRGEFKDRRKPVAYAFATEEEYLRFSPDSAGTQGRFRWEQSGKEIVKDLAWFSTPHGEADFYKTEFEVVQHEATHQLLDAYTGNPRVPKWFHEGCATFFESWDLDRKNEDNFLSGLKSHYSLGISLTFPNQKPAPPLGSYWISPRDLLNLDHEPAGPIRRPPPKKRKDQPLDFQEQMQKQQEYNQSWCAITFFINHRKGQEVFKLFIEAFREPSTDLAAIRKKYYTEEFVTSFQKEWYKFIEAKVLGSWNVATVGGTTQRIGFTGPPPAETKGYPLTEDRRGDMFLVQAERRQFQVDGNARNVWMLKAWSVPVSLYEEAWSLGAELLAERPSRLVGGIYGLGQFLDPMNPEFAAFFLVPAWSSLSEKDSEELGLKLTQAVSGLITPAHG